MSISKLLASAVAVLCVAGAWAQPAAQDAHIGYVFPAGGQRGETFEVLVGGQGLRGANAAYVTGEGVHAEVIQFYRPLKNLDRDQRTELQRRIRSAYNRCIAELPEGERPPMPPWVKAGQQGAKGPKGANAKNVGKAKTPKGKGAQPPTSEAKPAGPVEIPEHPMFRDLEEMDLRELHHLTYELANFRKRQPNTQIAESVLLRVTVDPGAEPGDRELRVATPGGLTNPMVFQVGTAPEVREQEPNDQAVYPGLPDVTPVEVPFVVNGQIMPGDVDRVRFKAKEGQNLVIETQARHLVPYLADAVPGWFQATLTLRDAKGAEVAYADDYRFHPDPVLLYAIPAGGIYELEIRDSIFRGREDFVYRVAVGESPFITDMFPLGGKSGAKTVAAIDGWNLPKERLALDTKADGICHTALHAGQGVSNEVAYAVDSLPECEEGESNDTAKSAHKIELPCVVNGRIERPGDVDMFQFKGRKDDEVVAEVYARRLQSPLDSLLRLTDASGEVVEWNDDYSLQEKGYLHTGPGLITHHADSYLTARLPKNGKYLVSIADTQNQGGDAYAYRLRISPPQPDFALQLTPSSLSMPAGRAAALCVHIVRKDGFDGPVNLALDDAPSGFRLDGATIPAGRDHIRFTLSAPMQPFQEPVALRIVGQAEIDGQTITHPALPSEDMMQAFLYRHLAPSQELLVAVTKPQGPRPGQGGRKGPAGRRGPRARGGGDAATRIAVDGPVNVPEGGAARVNITMPKHPRLKDLELELSDPPEGFTIANTEVTQEGLAFEVKAEGEALQAGYTDNLIVEAFLNIEFERKDGSKQQRRVSAGVLPAISIEIVTQ